MSLRRKGDKGEGLHFANRAAVAKQWWDIASTRDCLWFRWIDGVYLKGGNPWDYCRPKFQ